MKSDVTNMVHKEAEPLLSNPSAPKSEHKTAFHYVQLLPCVLSYYITSALQSYVINEWIQHCENLQIFGKETVNISSQCGDENKSDPNYSLSEAVESETSEWQMFCSFGVYIPAIVIVSVLPSYSDCFGRRVLFIVACAGLFAKMTISSCVIYFNLHPIYFVLASILDGISGSFFTMGSGFYSFVADLTERGRKRTVGVTIVDSIVMLCITLAGLGSGYFIQSMGYFIPIASCAGLSFIALLTALFIVPETFHKHKHSKSRSLCVVFKRTFAFYFSDTFKKKRAAYLLLVSAYICVALAVLHRGNLEILYTLGKPFCWSPRKIGLFSSMRNIVQGAAGMFLIKPLKMCLSDVNIALLSLAFGIGSYVLEALARTDLMMYMVPLAASLAFLCSSTVKSLMSSITPAENQGSLFSSIVFTEALCLLVANSIFNMIYSVTVDFMSGFVFLVLAGLCLLAIVVLIIFSAFRRDIVKEDVREQIVNTQEDNQCIQDDETPSRSDLGCSRL